MSDTNDNRYQRWSNEQLAEGIFREGAHRAFCEAFGYPMPRNYAVNRRERMMNSLRQGTRHHLENNFSDEQFSEGDDNIYRNSFYCSCNEMGEEMYDMFVEEVHRHVVQNILPKLKAVDDESLLKALASSWKTHKDTILTFSELFRYLTLWIEDVPEGEVVKNGIGKIGLNEFKNVVVLEEEIKKRLTSLLQKPTEEHGEGAPGDGEEIRKIRDMLVDMECCKEFEDK